MGWCPSGRLFEAAACGTPILSDWWDGLDDFFVRGEEILMARRPTTLAALDLPDRRVAHHRDAARERVLAEHTADHRAAQLVGCCRNPDFPQGQEA